jgi:hypothetical protein
MPVAGCKETDQRAGTLPASNRKLVWICTTVAVYAHITIIWYRLFSVPDDHNLASGHESHLVRTAIYKIPADINGNVKQFFGLRIIQMGDRRGN